MSSKLPSNSHSLNIARPVLALVFSALIHFFLFNQFEHIAIEPEFGNIEVELANPIHSEKTIPRKSETKNQVSPKRASLRRKEHTDIGSNQLNDKEIKPKNNDSALPAVAENSVTNSPPENPQALEHHDNKAQDETASNKTSPAPEIPQDEQLNPPADAAMADLNQLPTRMDIAFDIHRGNAKIGVAQVHFERSNGNYHLTSERRATGLAAAIVKAKDIEVSEGKVSTLGLKPVKFSHQFGKDGKKVHYADFDWTSAKLNLHENETSTLVDLPQDTQDMLSFMYQFMFVPPLSVMQITLTNGRKINQYAYSFEGEETIKTGLGLIQTLHITKNSGSDEEKLELWLGKDYHHLPMKIRKTEKDGTVYEQILNKLEIN